jgi:hypothetical protein
MHKPGTTKGIEQPADVTPDGCWIIEIIVPDDGIDKVVQAS